MTKCNLCGAYFGPFSMEKHLQQDHAVGLSDKEAQAVYDAGYDEGYGDGIEEADPDSQVKWIKKNSRV